MSLLLEIPIFDFSPQPRRLMSPNMLQKMRQGHINATAKDRKGFKQALQNDARLKSAKNENEKLTEKFRDSGGKTWIF